MPEPDWWAPLGAPGELRVRELVADETLRYRALQTERVQEIPLAQLTLVGQDLVAEVGHRVYLLRSTDRAVVRITVPEGKQWQVQVAGDDLEMEDQFVDVRAPDDGKLEHFHVLRFSGAHGSWVVHFIGGRVAGARLVLTRGDEPGHDPVVSCVPAARSRDLPTARLRRRQPPDVHVTSWTGDAAAAEVALLEMLVLTGRHGGLDYLPAAFVGAAREIGGLWRMFTPVPEPLPTKAAEPSGLRPPQGDTRRLRDEQPRARKDT